MEAPDYQVQRRKFCEAIREGVMFKHLLVPLDGSEYAEEALTAARELSTRFDSDITLLCVVIPVDTLLSMQRGYAASFPEIAALVLC